MLQRQSASPNERTCERSTSSPGGPPAFQLLPAIDLRGGQVVRLAEGDFARETVYGTDPAAVAESFAAAGARWIHVVDLDGARDGERRQTETIGRIVAAAGEGVCCEVAGGLRNLRAVEEALAAGARRAVVGTAVLQDPDLAARLVERFGAERVAIALDIRDGVAVGQGWVSDASGLDASDALTMLADRGATTFIVTAIARDGLLAGPDLDLLARMVAIGRGDVIASAGVTTLDDIAATRRVGCIGAIVGRAIYEGRLDLAAAIRSVSAA